MFTPLHTQRLVVRRVRADDLGPFLDRRNDPRVARFQDWQLPYPQTLAEEIITRAAAEPLPSDGQWWSVSIDLADTGEVIGELVLHLTHGCRTAEIGYTLAAAHWGNGYTVEALEPFVAWVFDTFPVTRVWGGLHPDNRPSAMVLERVGLLFEGQHRLSYWLGDDNSDDWVYGATREDWQAWRDRLRTPPEHVRLVPIGPDNARVVRALRTHHTQRAFVAPVVDSFADALVPELENGAPVVPWLRAIEADDELVGFVMLALATAAHPEPYLWRLLVDRMHQRRGIASRALELVTAQCRDWGAEGLRVSWVEGPGSPHRFYQERGFVPTGRIDEGETEARLVLGR